MKDNFDDGLEHGNFTPIVVNDDECKHKFWIKRCSMCKAILESDSQCNIKPGESLKMSYNEFDTIVCSYILSKQLKELKIKQISKLYWVEIPEMNSLFLRTHDNSAKINNCIRASAFTSSELCRHLIRLSHKNKKVDFKYVGTNAHDPNRLARLLIKLLTTHEFDHMSLSKAV